MSRPDSVIVNGLVRQALVSAEEVMGANGLNAVLRASNLERYIDNFHPNDMQPAIKTSDYARLNEAIEQFYGRGGRGMLKRIGKASFQYGIREQAALLGITEAVQWATGKEYRIVETNCLAKGDEYCRFEVGQARD